MIRNKMVFALVFVGVVIFVGIKIPGMVNTIRENMAHAKLQDAVVDALAVNTQLRERMIERSKDTVLFEEMANMIEKAFKSGLRDAAGEVRKDIKGFTHTQGFIFIAYENEDYQSVGTYGDLLRSNQ